MYENAKPRFIDDKTIHKENREWLKEFFEKEEYKLKRRNGLTSLDEQSYKTLYGYTYKLRNVIKWFENRPIKKMSDEEFRKRFKKIYDDLEDGKIITARGEPLKDKKWYYNSVFRSKPFEMLRKTDLVKEIMEFHSGNADTGEVRYFEEITFKQMVDVAIKPEHKLLMWLSWDIGENITALLRLQKKHFVRQMNTDTKEAEYRINLPKEFLKRSRTSRSEITNYRETVQLLDIVFNRGKKAFVERGGGKGIHKIRQSNGKYYKLHGDWINVPYESEDSIFNFDYRQAAQILDRGVMITNAVCIPKGQIVTWKDFRSSMACHLLRQGWDRDEINARLGHKPSSREIDKYINFLAIDRTKPKKKVYESQIGKLTEQVEDFQSREKLYQQRVERTQDEIEEIKSQLLARKKLDPFFTKIMNHPSFKKILEEVN